MRLTLSVAYMTNTSLKAGKVLKLPFRFEEIIDNAGES